MFPQKNTSDKCPTNTDTDAANTKSVSLDALNRLAIDEGKSQLREKVCLHVLHCFFLHKSFYPLGTTTLGTVLSELSRAVLLR